MIFNFLAEGGGSGGNSNYETLGGQGATAQGGYTGGFDNKSDMPPQYQPPNNQPFPWDDWYTRVGTSRLHPLSILI